MQRFAIYFSPAPETPLARAAAAWLGRDIRGKELQPLPVVSGLDPARLDRLLQSPRHYGFHATLKPPFVLKPGSCAEDLDKRLHTHAAGLSAFMLPQLKLALLGNFFCLVTQEPPALQKIAADLVRDFDDLRRPPTAMELEKRRAAGLSPNQEAMLQAWGYPYVLDEFRFHLTLTGPVTDPKERERVAEELERRFPAALLQGICFDALSLFREENARPLHCLARYPLAKGDSSLLATRYAGSREAG